MATKPDPETVGLYLTKLETQISEQRRLVDVLRELGDAIEAEKAASRLAALQESHGALVFYRELLEEEVRRQRQVH